MERKSRVSRYQSLRDQINTEPDHTVKSDDLYQYSKKIDQLGQVSAEPEFHFEPESGAKAPAGSQDYLDQLKQDNQKIDELIKQNEALIGKPDAQKSRAQRFAGLAEHLGQESAAEQAGAAPAEPAAPAPRQAEKDVFMADLDDGDKQPAETPAQTESAIRKAAEANEYTEPDFDIDSLNAEEPAESAPADDKDSLLEQTINEAKSYSMEKGQRSAIDTTSAIIAELTDQPQEPVSEAAAPAAAMTDVPNFDDLLETKRKPGDAGSLDSDIEELLTGKPAAKEAPSAAPEPAEKPAEPAPAAPEAPAEEQPEAVQPAAEDAIRDDDLDKSFFLDDEAAKPAESSAAENEAPAAEKPAEEPEEQPAEDVSDLTEAPKTNPAVDPASQATINDLTQKLDKEHVLRADLEQQTKQMKLEMNELGTEVTTVSKRMNRTNMILNFVLVVLIVALFAILGFIAYWALVDRGILPSKTGYQLNASLLAMLSQSLWL